MKYARKIKNLFLRDIESNRSSAFIRVKGINLKQFSKISNKTNRNRVYYLNDSKLYNFYHDEVFKWM